jgi:hypothetical protein
VRTKNAVRPRQEREEERLGTSLTTILWTSPEGLTIVTEDALGAKR